MNKREWKRYAKDLEDYVVAQIDRIRHSRDEPEPEIELVEVEVEKKWIAKLILDLRAHYLTGCGRAPTHIFLPPEYLETLLLELPPGTLGGFGDNLGLRIFGMGIVSKPEVDRRPFAMWENRGEDHLSSHVFSSECPACAKGGTFDHA